MMQCVGFWTSQIRQESSCIGAFLMWIELVSEHRASVGIQAADALLPLSTDRARYNRFQLRLSGTHDSTGIWSKIGEKWRITRHSEWGIQCHSVRTNRWNCDCNYINAVHWSHHSRFSHQTVLDPLFRPLSLTIGTPGSAHYWNRNGFLICVAPIEEANQNFSTQ